MATRLDFILESHHQEYLSISLLSGTPQDKIKWLLNENKLSKSN
jgi:hypothetical protein